jgi:hypothetical protein
MIRSENGAPRGSASNHRKKRKSTNLVPSICIQNIYMVVSCCQKHRLAVIAKFDVRNFRCVSTD